MTENFDKISLKKVKKTNVKTIELSFLYLGAAKEEMVDLTQWPGAKGFENGSWFESRALKQIT